MKILIILSFTLICFLSNSQKIQLAIFDEMGKVNDCSVYKNDSIIEQFEKIFQIKQGDKITITHNWYRDTTFFIQENLSIEDTLYKYLELKQKVKKISEVIVTSEKYEILYEKSNEFVFDYYPLPKNNVLLISKIGKNRFLKLVDEDSEPLLTLSLKITPNELFLDAMGNFHILTKDSAYQVQMTDSSLSILNGVDQKVFNSTISNLLSIDNDKAFYKNYSKHSQLFTIETLSKQHGREEIYQTFDQIGFRGAQDSYNDMIRYYLANIPEWRNIILLGLWNGDAYDLVDPLDANLNHMYTWYKKIMALPLKVSAFGMLDNIVILDNVKNTISTMDYTTCKVVQKVAPQFELSRHYYFDYFFDALYTFTEKKGITEVFQIDIKTGKAKSIALLTDVLLPRNIKISNKWVYFTLLDEDGYNKVLKVKR